MYDNDEAGANSLVDSLLKKKILTKCYYEFNGIISLGQFINLGLALVGLLSRVYCILIDMRPQKKAHKDAAGTAAGINPPEADRVTTEDTSEDFGEIVESEPKKVVAESSKDKHKPFKIGKDKKDKKKRKKGKSDIDLIFG